MKRCVRDFSGVAGCAMLLVFLGQATAPAGGEVERLRAENAELRKEIAETKEKMAAGGTAQTQPAKKEVVRNFTTMMDVLANVPADIRPQAKPEWYKFTQGKFVQWVEEQMVGMTVDVSLGYSGGPTHPKIGFNGGTDGFVVYSGSFDAKHFTYFGADHSWSVKYPQMTFDEAGARKWDAIKRGTLFKVKGVIKSVTMGRTNYGSTKLPEYHLTFELRDLEIMPPK